MRINRKDIIKLLNICIDNEDICLLKIYWNNKIINDFEISIKVRQLLYENMQHFIKDNKDRYTISVKDNYFEYKYIIIVSDFVYVNCYIMSIE